MNEDQASDTYLIVGLGNPGRTHRGNRHNVGFMTLDILAAKMKQDFSRLEHESLVAEGELGGKKVILAKPQTFMNVSGAAVSRLAQLHDVPHTNLLVISDDIDLPLGQIRLRPFGGTGGHKGLKSIQEQMGIQDFPRLRIGIGRPPGRTDPADFVLDDFTENELEEIEIDIRRAADCVLLFLSEGIQAAMTSFNRTAE
jgi:PTH1 family peptidyl-tRNA hydrolase